MAHLRRAKLIFIERRLDEHGRDAHATMFESD
jgi:hypothetical protein